MMSKNYEYINVNKLDPVKRFTFDRSVTTLMAKPKMKTNFALYHQFNPQGGNEIFAVYNKAKDLCAVMMVYGINKEEKSAYFTVSLLNGHEWDKVEGTTVSIYAPISIHGARLLASTEELGFKLQKAVSVLMTLAEDGDTERLMRRSRLMTVAKGLVNLPMTTEIMTVGENKFLTMVFKREEHFDGDEAKDLGVLE